jgi:chorismate lyase/3-hydroxybenzoate synthase
MNATQALPGCAQLPPLRYYAEIAELPPDVLGAIVYGLDARRACGADPRLVPVPLAHRPGSARVEAWLAAGPCHSGEFEGIRLRSSDGLLFASLELDEAAHGGPRGAGREAYQRLMRLHAQHRELHVWRIWNFIAAINEGAGDAERYRLFCVGRAEGLGAGLPDLPAASALGRCDGERMLQLVWIAGPAPGVAVENPRQVPAWRYPRQYGPAAPSFSRAMRIGAQVTIAGTASIVGHESLHRDNLRAQVNESLDNLAAVTAAAGLGLAQLGAIKAYVREAGDMDEVAAQVAARHPGGPACVVQADICRADLLVELEAIGSAAADGPA